MTAMRAVAIRHVDLALPLPDLALTDLAPRDVTPDPALGEPASGLLAIFWHRGIPLGSRLFTAGELPVPGAALRALAAAAVAPALVARGVDTLGEIAPPRLPDPRPRLCVIVCTRDRPADLARCLASLLACDPAPDEIVVVDNAPATGATRELAARHPQVTYVLEPQPGLSRARNAGIKASSGEIVAFTDDDVEVAPGWLGALAAGFADPAVGAVSGVVLPASLGSPAAAAFELTYGGLTSTFLPATFEPDFLETSFGEAPAVWKAGAGANMAFRRRALEAAGPFDIRLGAGAAGCSEDSEMIHRLLLGGWTCRLDPAAFVFHRHRDTLPALRRQLRGYVRGHVAALLVQYRQTGATGNLMRAFVGLPAWYLFLIPRSLWVGDWLRLRLLPTEIGGLVEGWFALIRYRRPAPAPAPARAVAPAPVPAVAPAPVPDTRGTSPDDA